MQDYFYKITSKVDGKSKTEGFYLQDELDLAMDDLDYFSHLRLDEYYPLEDGNIGFHAPNGIVLLEESCLS